MRTQDSKNDQSNSQSAGSELSASNEAQQSGIHSIEGQRLPPPPFSVEGSTIQRKRLHEEEDMEKHAPTSLSAPGQKQPWAKHPQSPKSLQPPPFQLQAAPFQRKVIQRVPQKSYWGEFKDVTYDAQENDSGVDIKIEFHPNEKVDATKIGLSQSVLGTSQGQVENIHPNQEHRTVEKGPGEGYAIDRISSSTNPIYGAENLPAGKDLSETEESNDEGGIYIPTYKLGHRYNDKNGNLHKEEAWLTDRPRGSVLDDSGQVFETTALALDGGQKNQYYGSVKWGWTRDDQGKYNKLDFDLVSESVPSQNFLAAAEKWNSATATGTIVTRNANTQVYKFVSGSGYQKDYIIPDKFTKIEVDGSVGSVVAYNSIKVLEGPKINRTGRIKVTDLLDKGDGPDTTDLPIPAVKLVHSTKKGYNQINLYKGPLDDILDADPLIKLDPDTRIVIVHEQEVFTPYVEVVQGPHTGEKGYVSRLEADTKKEAGQQKSAVQRKTFWTKPTTPGKDSGNPWQKK